MQNKSVKKNHGDLYVLEYISTPDGETYTFKLKKVYVNCYTEEELRIKKKQ